MHKLLAFFAAALILVAGPAVAIDEDLRITAAAATSDQVSGTITLPPTVNGMIVVMDVTVAVGVLLDIGVEFYSPGAGAWVEWAGNCPSAGGITGTGTTVCF
ncbi:MAG: hypothetical protein OET63_04890, partial [Desulfobacterales bacterium]|nr:hypothetical protein [Desulfobacterales bacterium]